MPETKFIINNESILNRCIELAKKGRGHVSPNPMVGCVIVKNGKVVAEGYHRQFGSHHAEVNAINTALSKQNNLKDSSMYVNLEPCVHYGKTPPCVDVIIENKIREVVIGSKDPNPLVAGKGINKLKKNKIKVTSGVLESECLELNKFYIKHMKKGLPYITLKAAQTIDAKIAELNGDSKWISSPGSRKYVHRLRSEYDAVLVGRNTVEKDDPELTVRLVKGRNPYRVVIDKGLVLNLNNKLFSDKFTEKTIIITAAEPGEFLTRYFEQKKIRVVKAKSANGIIDLKDAMKKLAKLGISSVLVEGGAFTFTEFIKQKMVDEILLFTSPKMLGKGLSTFKTDSPIDLPKFKSIISKISGKDILTDIKF